MAGIRSNSSALMLPPVSSSVALSEHAVFAELFWFLPAIVAAGKAIGAKVAVGAVKAGATAIKVGLAKGAKFVGGQALRKGLKTGAKWAIKAAKKQLRDLPNKLLKQAKNKMKQALKDELKDLAKEAKNWGGEQIKKFSACNTDCIETKMKASQDPLMEGIVQKMSEAKDTNLRHLIEGVAVDLGDGKFSEVFKTMMKKTEGVINDGNKDSLKTLFEEMFNECVVCCMKSLLPTSDQQCGATQAVSGQTTSHTHTSVALQGGCDAWPESYGQCPLDSSADQFDGNKEEVRSAAHKLVVGIDDQFNDPFDAAWFEQDLVADVQEAEYKSEELTLDDYIGLGWDKDCDFGALTPTLPSIPSNGGCFAKDSTTVCLLVEDTPTAVCEHVLMAELVPGDLVLGHNGPTTVVANQHKKIDTIAEMLTITTADGTSLSLTPDHGLFVDSILVAAADAKIGAFVTNNKGEATVITHITKGEAAIINTVTASGTIVANGIFAASNPLWISAVTVDAPLARTVVNVIAYAAGDVDSVSEGVVVLSAKIVATLVAVGLVLKARTAS